MGVIGEVSFTEKCFQTLDFQISHQKILEAYERNMGVKEASVYPLLHNPISGERESYEVEINFKYALGWIVAAVFGGVLVSIWLLGLLK